MKQYKFAKSVFDKDAILKTVYLWQDILVSEDKFNSDLQEQQLRETLNGQFGELREAIYNKAFERFEVS